MLLARVKLYLLAFAAGSFFTLVLMLRHGAAVGYHVSELGARFSLAGGELQPLTSEELQAAADRAVTASVAAMYGAPSAGKAKR